MNRLRTAYEDVLWLASAQPEDEVHAGLRVTVEDVVTNGLVVGQLEPSENGPELWLERETERPAHLCWSGGMPSLSWIKLFISWISAVRAALKRMALPVES